MARLAELDGDLDRALALLDEADREYNGDYAPNVRPVPAMRARLRVRRGELGPAVSWARERGLSHDDEPVYLREFEHITLARILLGPPGGERPGRRETKEVRDATGLLERLRAAAEAGGRHGSVIEILVLLSRAHHLRGDLSAALAALQHAVALAEPEGYERVFADEGPALAWLLNALTKQAGTTGYLRQLIAASTGRQHRPVDPTALVAPLSDREMDVLRLLGSDLNGPEIARELSVSLNTLRTHTKSIYAKLGVNSRRAAVRQAQELELPRT
jgi:LuxR family maltose regulon positive regulatory protein